MKPFVCENDSCALGNLICAKCCYESTKKEGNRICKRCSVAEEDSDSDDDSVDYAAEAAKPSNFTLVATVSYNKERRDFDYDKYNASAFEGAEKLNKEAYAEKADAIYEKHRRADE